MDETRKEPETPDELFDGVWNDSVRASGRLFNTRAFWIPGLLAGTLGFVACLVWVKGEVPLRLVFGLSSFLVLWLGVGVLGATLARRRS